MAELTPEQQQQYRLGQIFLPHNTAEVTRRYPALSGTARFAHYTCAEAALKIIRSKRVWMRNATCMVDYREIRHGFDILRELFAPDARRADFFQALDACAPGVAMEAIQAFDSHWGNIQRATYIASVSEHHDTDDRHGRLSMWRAFGDGARVAMVISIPYFTGAAQAMNVIFSPVAYMDKAQVNNELTKVIAAIRANTEFLKTVDRRIIAATIYLMLLAGVICLKHEGFREEAEWRAFLAPFPIQPKVALQKSIQSFSGVPQHVYELPLDASVGTAVAGLDFAQVFDRVILGPTQYPGPVAEALIEALAAAGVENAAAKVFASNIPIRT